MLDLFAKLNFKWQYFVEEKFGMGNFSCPTYQRELNKNKKGK